MNTKLKTLLQQLLQSPRRFPSWHWEWLSLSLQYGTVSRLHGMKQKVRWKAQLMEMCFGCLFH